MDWRTANDLPGSVKPEIESLRAEVARLRGLFIEAERHPASAWWYVAQALGRPTILSAAPAAAAPAAHPPP
jgi:hypothetical protein